MKNFVRLFCIIIASIFSLALYGQESKDTVFVWENITIHIGNGEVIQDGIFAFQGDRIIYSGIKTNFKIPSITKKYNGNGHHIYPGLIALNTQLGINEIEAVSATVDQEELGSFNPNIRSLIAFNSSSEVIPTILSNGILFAQIAPQGTLLAGRSSLVKLESWNWEDACVKNDNGSHLYWPDYPNSEQKSDLESYQSKINILKHYFFERMGIKNANDITNLKHQAIQNILEKKIKLFIHAENQQSILDAIIWANEMKINFAIIGNEGLIENIQILKQYKIPVIINSVFRLPSHEDQDITYPFETAKKLKDSGILFAISVSGFWGVRNLPFHAGQCVAFGLKVEEALESITLSPAKILEISDDFGSLEYGKYANFILCEGDILDMKSSMITQAFIFGKKINLNNKQKELYTKYKSKYEGKKSLH